MIAFINFHKLLDLPVLASRHGKDVDNFIIYVHWLMGILFVGWLAYFFYAIYRFRATKNPKANYYGVQNHASNYIEVAVIVAEVVLLFAFAVPLWARVVEDFPSPAQSTEVQVVGRQFLWTFRYPGKDGVFGRQDPQFVTADNEFGVDPGDPNGKDDFDMKGEMVVPVNTSVIAYVSSLDVVHSFSVHPMRITQDAVPGMRIPTHFLPTKEGEYWITCAQLCGTGHYTMKAKLRVVSQEEYDEWLAEKAPAQATPETVQSYE